MLFRSSTMAQTLALASIFVDSGAADLCAAVTSSHFCAAERQFRFPLEYGGQRPPTAQWTATAAGSAVVGLGGNGVRVADVSIGRIVDLGMTDANNMGAAMAPAAAETLASYCLLYTSSAQQQTAFVGSCFSIDSAGR